MGVAILTNMQQQHLMVLTCLAATTVFISMDSASIWTRFWQVSSFWTTYWHLVDIDSDIGLISIEFGSFGDLASVLAILAWFQRDLVDFWHFWVIFGHAMGTYLLISTVLWILVSDFCLLLRFYFGKFCVWVRFCDFSWPALTSDHYIDQYDMHQL